MLLFVYDFSTLRILSTTTLHQSVLCWWWVVVCSYFKTKSLCGALWVQIWLISGQQHEYCCDGYHPTTNGQPDGKYDYCNRIVHGSIPCYAGKCSSKCAGEVFGSGICPASMMTYNLDGHSYQSEILSIIFVLWWQYVHVRQWWQYVVFCAVSNGWGAANPHQSAASCV